MKHKVLVIEDSRSFSQIITELLQTQHGFETDVAVSMAQAQALLRDNVDQYFVATVDLNLPDAPNGEAIELVRKFNIPIVVFTSTNDDAIEKSLWDRGISDYVSKFGHYNLTYLSWITNRIYRNQNIQLLVAQKDEHDLHKSKRLLKKHLFTVRTASSGADALSILEQNEGINLVIVDSELTDMPGLKLTHAIRERYPGPEMEIIGLADANSSTKFVKTGADDFLDKPFQPEQLFCRLNHAVDRQERYRELLQLNQTKNQLLGTAAHDIRGPLATIYSSTDYLLKRDVSAERTQKMIEMVNSSSRDLISLLETLLDASAIESGEVSLDIDHFDLSELVNERLDLYHDQASQKKLALETDIMPKLLIQGDKIKVRQVIDNLLTNAIKYSFPGNTIEVTLQTNTDNVLFSAKDGGPGIPSDEHSKLFQAFTVLSTKTTGGEKRTGLGLAITKKIVDAHEGNVYYKHDDTCHSTFFVELPRMQGA